MIVVDEDADRRLIKTLEALRSTPGSARCLVLKLANYPQPRFKVAEIRPAFLETIRQATLPNSPQVFFCEDGDIFILASFLATREAQRLMADIGAMLSIPARGEFMEFFEVALQANALLIQVEAKLAKRQQAINEAKKRFEEQQRAKKRDAILASPDAITAHEIALKRIARDAALVMLIEDDAFSCRLVANVLKKDYALHTLSSADDALTTYARLAPDIVFLDIDLPTVSGHELLEKMIALDPSAYVVMLSGNADRENIMQAMNRGAKGFIGKPFTREKLFQYLDRCPTLNRQKEGD